MAEGPWGFEAAAVFGRREYDVMLAEATRTLGGCAAREAALPGMSEYSRSRYHSDQKNLNILNLEIRHASWISTEDVLAVGVDYLAIAAGAAWRPERFAAKACASVAKDGERVLTADDVMNGVSPEGLTVVFDGDDGYLAGVIA